MERFNFNADTFEEAENYLINRSIQLTMFNVKLLEIVEIPEGAIAYFNYKNTKYQSIYILSKHRGNGTYMKYFRKNPLPIVTTDDCKLVDFLKYKNISYNWFNLRRHSNGYDIIKKFYGDGKAERSGQYFMNHIDEGLSILEYIGGSSAAKEAYCLHPILQSDEELNKFYHCNNDNFREVSMETILCTMEYRSVANEYLSNRSITSLDEIRLSPIKDVNDMLIADKIQNRKDFELYHEGKHPRSVELAQYFKNWLGKLGISENTYQDFKEKLTINYKTKIKI